jgi:hypothetical protein
MMPIRFPTEAANDPDGKLNGTAESTGEDEVDVLRGGRGRARGLPDRPERADKETRGGESRGDQPSPGKDSSDK